jgi:D-arabinose 1-dehydrogenase-like Zn-dependent alcohol dehydrogenase
MRARLTHLCFWPRLGPGAPPDALARAEDAAGNDGERLFVPGWLPCGECGRCRRGLVSTCAAGRPLLPGSTLASPAASVDIPDRFLTPVDAPPGVGPLGDAEAACAGAVAALVDAVSNAALAPGDVAVWLGEGDALARLGAVLTSARGCPSFLVGHTAKTAPRGVTLLSGDARAAWDGQIEAVESDRAQGQRARRLFVTSLRPALLAAAAALAGPGASITCLSAAAPLPLPPLELPPRARLIHGGGYHPDFVPEALAALRRGEVSLEGQMVNARGPDDERLVVVELGR